MASPSDHQRQTSTSSFSDADESPFFADITLDLAEAHDMAMTPEATQKKLVVDHSTRDIPRMPMIPDDPISPPEGAMNELEITAPDYPVFDDMQGNPLNSITSDRAGNVATTYNQNKLMPTSARKWPRDVSWAAAFCIVVPLSLLLPMMFAPSGDSWLATATAPRLATLHTLLWGYVAALLLSRLLYRTMGGGDGDDARHVASQVLLASAPISISVYICLVLSLYFMLPKALHYAVIPLWFLARDLYLFRRWKMTATTPGGRQAFFQALSCLALDILSRSLRRSSFYRIISALLVVQLVFIMWWRLALMAAMQSGSFFWVCVAALGGKWATGTVARLLSLVASGGICSWFSEQNSLVEELQELQKIKPDDDEEMIEFVSSNADNKSDDGNMPEAYRSASASAYQSALVPDEGMDDDYFDDEEEGAALQPRSGMLSMEPRGSTVKQLLFSGLTISFGSVAKCGLLGGFAQFLWSQIRKIDTARATFGDFHGMSIGQTNEHSTLNIFLSRANLWAREFVRGHSDMAMSHVASFQKSYHRAAQDVAILIDQSGEFL